MSRREPTEAEWLRRAIRHCEHWGGDTPEDTSVAVHNCIMAPHLFSSPWSEARDGDAFAGWLPAEFRTLTVEDLRARLAALETAAAQE